ncbi:M50 family metallopeptidase [Nocardioides terrisoli]|uniref:M50 family metallopeptidase n=1 Tax=Nocardioides terrisoli TaxID=3388267 RepID=UPI00287BBF5C|nr:site-2 protease family protein [Nocardioides marmorisolisilvae]
MTTALLYLAGVVIFAVGVAVSIALHELGHLIPGKLYDVKITQYFIGFGRTIWSRRRGETEYGLKAVPLGGYVKLVGMLPPGPDQDPGQMPSRNTGMFAQLVSDARSQEYEAVDEADHDRLFYVQPWWKRVVIMGSGVAVNLVLAFLLFAVVFMGYGALAPTTTVATVSQCVKVVHIDEKPGPCTSADPLAPARKAGLRPGDHLVSFNGTTIDSYDQLQGLIRANEAGAATIVVDRNGHRRTLQTNTAINVLPSRSDVQRSVRAGFLGITPTVTLQRQDVGYVVTTMASGTWDTLKTIGTLPQKLYHVGRAALGLEKRSTDSPMSVVGAGRVAGQLASDHHNSIADRFFSLLLLLAGLNLFLGLINLVPLPPFDGGGIATTLYEAVRRGVARLLGRPDPGVVDAAKLLPVTYAMAVVILVVSVVLIYADIVAPVSLT